MQSYKFVGKKVESLGVRLIQGPGRKTWPFFRSLRSIFLFAFLLPLSGCSVIAVADAAVSVGATVVSAGASVVGAAVDVTAAGVRAVTGSGSDDKSKKANAAESAGK